MLVPRAPRPRSLVVPKFPAAVPMGFHHSGPVPQGQPQWVPDHMKMISKVSAHNHLLQDKLKQHTARVQVFLL